VTYLLETIPKKYHKELWILRGILASIIGNYKIAKSDFSYAERRDPDNYITFIKDKNPITLNIFPPSSRLCNYYPFVKISFPSFSSNMGTYILMRPSFSFPFIRPPNMIPSLDDNIFEQFTVNALKIKPEAPWIKRGSHGIKFTDNIQVTEYDDNFEISDDGSEKDRKKKAMDPLLKRLYIRTNSQNYGRVKYFSKEQEREEMKALEEEDSKGDNLSLDSSNPNNEYLQEFEKFGKMKDQEKVFDDLHDEYDDTSEKDAFDLDIEIPDDDEDYQMHTPSRGKDSDDDLLL